MSAINFKIITIAFIIFSTFACKKDTANKPMISSKIHVSSYSYKGLVEKSVKLNFRSEGQNPTTLTAFIEVPYNYEYPVQYEWKLGQGVILKNGSLKGEISSLQENQKIEISIDVDGFSQNEKRFVRLEVIGKNPSRRIYADGIYASDVASSFESIVQEVENYKKYHAKDSE